VVEGVVATIVASSTYFNSTRANAHWA
jgi:hypothetical protein